MKLDLELNHLLFPFKVIPTLMKIANRMCFRTFRTYHSAILQNATALNTPSSLTDRTITVNPTPTDTDSKTSSVFFDHVNGSTEENAVLPSSSSLPANVGVLPNSGSVLWENNFEDITKNKDIINDPFNAWLERFVKVTINYKVDMDELIPVATKQGTVEHYKIHCKIANNGLLAFALRPVEENATLSPLIVFRATETDIFAEEAINSMHNDLHPRIGEPGWTASKEEFNKLMADPSFRKEGDKVKIAGYSLGGVHAQYCIVEHLPNISHAVFYNNPSAHATVSVEFAEKIQKMELKTPILLQIFRTVGDPFHHFGEKHIGCGVDHPNLVTQLFEVEYPNQSMFDFSLHSKRIFDTSRFDYKITEYTDPLHLKQLLDNSQRDPITTSLEKGRKIFGKVLSCILSATTSLIALTLRLLGIRITRTYDREYIVRCS